jgi:hypothetical protein
MATSTLNTDIRARIDAFVAELTTMVKGAALESVRAVLGDGGMPARRGPGRPPKAASASSAPSATGARRGRPPGKSSRGGKRSTEEVDQMAERIATFVKSNPGLGLEAIASGIGTSTKELKLPVIKLLASRTLRKTGQKRGTKYFAGGGGGRGAGTPARKSAPKRRGKKARRAKGKRGARKAQIAMAA